MPEKVDPNIPPATPPAAEEEQIIPGAPGDPADGTGGDPGDAVAGEEPSIEEYNRKVAEQIGKEPPPSAEEEATGEEDEEAEDDTGADDDEETAGDDDTPVVTFEDGDDLNTVLEKGKKLKDSFEFSPEVDAYISRLETQAQSSSAGLEALPASPETVKEIVLAFDQVFETVPAPTADDPDRVVPNTKPVVELLRNKYTNEFVPIAEGILSSDSPKYKGASMMEHFIIDNFGAEKATAIFAYANANIPLPTIPAGANLPAGIDEKLAEAYAKLPEVKRFELDSLAEEVANLRERLKDATEFTKDDLATELKEKETRLNGELFTLDAIQSKITGDREAAERSQRQAVEQREKFTNTVTTEYNTEIFGMADTFIADLAPRLTFADSAVQPALARDINTRIFNALAFQINTDGTYSPDPMADYYAGQLKQEGVQFDFNEGRRLLQEHHRATANVIYLKSQQNVSPQALERAVAKKNSVMTQIKANQVDLLGQISSRYVKGVANGIGEQVEKQKAKKQAARPRIGGGGATRKGKEADPDQQIKDWNRRNAERIKDPEAVFEYHQG